MKKDEKPGTVSAATGLATLDDVLHGARVYNSPVLVNVSVETVRPKGAIR